MPTVERELSMNMVEFLTTDITDKVMADRLVYVLGKVNASISFKNGLGEVKAETWKV